MMVAVFVASGALLAWPSIAKMIGNNKEIGTLEATRLMNTGNALVLDIRDGGEFNGGRIPKSKNIPLSEISKRVDESGSEQKKEEAGEREESLEGDGGGESEER